MHHDAKTDVSPEETAKHGIKYVLWCWDLRLPRWYPEYGDSRLEMSAKSYQTTRRHIPEETILYFTNMINVMLR
jgi:hypothetical protein